MSAPKIFPLHRWSAGHELRALARRPFTPQAFRRPFGEEAIARAAFFGTADGATRNIGGNVTLGPLTATGSVAGRASGALGTTLGSLTGAGSVTVRVSAALGGTLAPLVAIGAAADRVTATSGATLAALTATGVLTVVPVHTPAQTQTTGGFLRQQDPRGRRQKAREARDRRAAALREAYGAIIAHSGHAPAETLATILRAIDSGLEPSEPRAVLPPAERVDFAWLAEERAASARLLRRLRQIAAELKTSATRAEALQATQNAETQGPALLRREPQAVPPIAAEPLDFAPTVPSPQDALQLSDIAAVVAEAAASAAARENNDDWLLLLAAA